MTKITIDQKAQIIIGLSVLFDQSWMYIRKDEILSQGKGIEIVCRKVRVERTKSVRKNDGYLCMDFWRILVCDFCITCI